MVRTVAEVRGDLCVAVVRAENARPLRPRVVTGARGRGPGEELEVRDGFRAMAHRSADAVVAGVTTADDNNVLALRVDVRAVLELRVEERLRIEL